MKKIIAANWKMNKLRAEAEDAAGILADAAKNISNDRQMIVFPPFTAISAVARIFAGRTNLAVGAQNVYPAGSGAFTGEIAPAMLQDAGAAWVLTGHSERRHALGESNAFVAEKTRFSLECGLKVMLCIGETLEERDAGNLEKVLAEQLSVVIQALSEASRNALAGSFAVAYEPVWAIGTGKVAGAAEVTAAHAAVRALLRNMLGDTASSLPILYGGSVKPDNAAQLLNLDNVDGLLVGGASLEAESFLQIANA